MEIFIDMDRRQFLSGLGGSAVVSMLPSATHAAAACTAPAETSIRIIDASKNLTHTAKQIADAGITTVMRFYTRLANFDHGAYQNTALSKTELKALEDQGLYQPAVVLTRLGFPNQLQHDSRWQTEGRLPWGLPLRYGRTIPAKSFAGWQAE